MHRLRAIILLLAPALAIASCATLPPAADQRAAIERAYAAYQRIRTAAVIAAPLLSPDLQATIAAAEARADVAFAFARAASSTAEQIEQLRGAETAAIEIAIAVR